MSSSTTTGHGLNGRQLPDAALSPILVAALTQAKDSGSETPNSSKALVVRRPLKPHAILRDEENENEASGRSDIWDVLRRLHPFLSRRVERTAVSSSLRLLDDPYLDVYSDSTSSLAGLPDMGSNPALASLRACGLSERRELVRSKPLLDLCKC